MGFRKSIAAVLIGIFLLIDAVFAIDFPRPAGYANDFAGVLTQNQRQELETKLADFEKETSNEITVAIVPSFQGLDRFSYSQQLFTNWGIGQKSRNNGVLFLIGPKEGLPFPERGEAFINVGRGLEGALPDATVNSILQHEVFPEFKAQNFFAGLQKGIDSMILATRGEYTAQPVSEVNEDAVGTAIIVGIWLVMIVLQYLASFLGRTKAWWLGGVLGGIGGAVLGVIFLTGVFILFSAFGLAAAGLIFDYLVSKNYEYRKKHGKPTDFWHSGGGFWFGGSGGSGGGFSGFGGGSSGGGGGGGGW